MSSAVTPSIASSAQVHPTAHIDPTSTIGEDVVVGAGVIIGPHCVIGARTRLRDRAMVVEHTTLGEDNDVHPNAVLGGDPQDLAFTGDDRGKLIVGNNNVFREGVTLNRSTQNGPPTVIGSNCFLMTNAHVGHNAQMGDNVIMANNGSLAGHSRVGNRCVMSANAAVHQFCNVGEGCMFQACGAASMHVPPFVIVTNVNLIVGINSVGLRRHPEMNEDDRKQVKQLFRMVYRRPHGHPIVDVVATMQQQTWSPGAQRFVDFIIDTLNQEGPRDRGLCSAGARIKSRH